MYTAIALDCKLSGFVSNSPLMFVLSRGAFSVTKLTKVSIRINRT